MQMSPWMRFMDRSQDRFLTRVKFDIAFSQSSLHWRQWFGPWIGSFWSCWFCIGKKCGLFEKVGTIW
jgi:hypothetical protein